MRASIRGKSLRHAFCVSALIGLLTACGGSNPGSASGDLPTGGTPSEEIQGIATPSSVAVVTATNAE